MATSRKKKTVSRKKVTSRKKATTRKKMATAGKRSLKEEIKKPAKRKVSKRQTSGNQVPSEIKKQQQAIEKNKKKDDIKVKVVKAKPEAPKVKKKKYERRNIKHIWPELGTVIIGRLKKQIFRAEIIDDPELTRDHGKAVRSLDKPELVAYTFNQAAQLFTRELREKNGMGDIANGWKWWRRESDNKRLFDIDEYSKVIEDD